MADWAIREANANDAPAVANVHVDCWRSTYKDLMPADFLQGLSYRSREERWRRRLEHPPDRSTLFVAEDHAGRILGFADGGPERTGDPLYDGELYALYLLPEHQRKGIGRRLFRSVAVYLAEHRFNGMLIWVLSENPNRHFYEALGGRFICEKEIEIGGAKLKESAYGWKLNRSN